MAPEETGAAAALVVPVAAADWLIGDRGPLPAHVPLVPLLRSERTEGVVADLQALFADVVPFVFDLDEVCCFPTGEVYLAPHPPSPFRHLTAELARRFGWLSRSVDQFPDLVPHLTVPLAEGEAIADVERRLRDHGALQGLATEAQLVSGAAVLAAFPFGTAAA